jgi:hypothetical protein
MSKIQDTITFSLSAEDTVVNNTVRIEARIVGMIPQDMTEQTLKDSIRAVTKKFIDTDWQYANMNRTAHPSGQEQIMLSATARVPESENYRLAQRAEEASRGTDLPRIVDATADTSPTSAQIDETTRKLRVVILKKAQDEQRLLSEASGDKYRLGALNFSQVFDSSANTRASSQSMAVMAGAAAAKTSYGSGFAGNDDSIGNAVKLTMQASVELRISR